MCWYDISGTVKTLGNDFPAPDLVWVWISCSHSCLDCLIPLVRMVYKHSIWCRKVPFQMRNTLLLLEKEIHYCLWLWLFDLRHNNVQTFSPHLLAKDQRTSGSTKLLVCKSRRINKKALDAEAGSNQRLLESYWAKHVYLIRT